MFLQLTKVITITKITTIFINCKDILMVTSPVNPSKHKSWVIHSRDIYTMSLTLNKYPINVWSFTPCLLGITTLIHKIKFTYLKFNPY